MVDPSRERAGEPEIATTTLAEIYLQQGLLDRALAIYRRVAERSPGDERAAARVTEIERELERVRQGEESALVPVGGSAAAPPVAPAPPVAAPPVATTTSGVPSGSVSDVRTRRVAPAADQDAEFQAWLARRS